MQPISSYLSSFILAKILPLWKAMAESTGGSYSSPTILILLICRSNDLPFENGFAHLFYLFFIRLRWKMCSYSLFRSPVLQDFTLDSLWIQTDKDGPFLSALSRNGEWKPFLLTSPPLSLRLLPPAHPALFSTISSLHFNTDLLGPSSFFFIY